MHTLNPGMAKLEFTVNGVGQEASKIKLKTSMICDSLN